MLSFKQNLITKTLKFLCMCSHVVPLYAFDTHNVWLRHTATANDVWYNQCQTWPYIHVYTGAIQWNNTRSLAHSMEKKQPGHSEKHFLLCSPDIQVWNDSFNSCTKLNVSEAVTCGDISDVLVMFRDVVVFCRRAAVRRVFAFLTRFPRAHSHVQCLQLWVKTQTVQRHTHLWNNLVDRKEKMTTP